MFMYMLLKIEKTFYLSINLDSKMSKMTTLKGIIIKKSVSMSYCLIMPLVFLLFK